MKIVVHSGTARAALAAVGAGLTAGKGAAVGIRSLAEVEGVAPADLLVASLPPAEVHPLGVARGYFEPIDRQDLAMAMRFRIARLVVSERPRVLVVPLPDAALWCDTEQRLGDLHRWLLDFSDDLTAVLHMAHPAEALADAFVAQVAAGRTTGLADEQRVGGDPAGWWQAAGELRAACRVPPQPSRHPLVQTPTPAVDAAGLAALWSRVFGDDAVLARELPPGLATAATLKTVGRDLALPFVPGQGPAVPLPSVPTLRRMLTMNRALAEIESRLGAVPWVLRDRALAGLGDDAPPLRARDLAALTAGLRGLKGAADRPVTIEGDPAFDPAPALVGLPVALEALKTRVAAQRAAREAALTGQASSARSARAARAPEPLSAAAETVLNTQAKEIYRGFAGGRFWPHNDGIVGFDEAIRPADAGADPAPFTRSLIVGCMKNEGPYILEWVAYHRAIGIDHFLIFTNDCTDGTDAILERLQALGIATHERNDTWKGKSPQQAALNRAMKMPLVRQAEWLIHIDVDEFINIRLGDGTMAELYQAMGDATNLAMTWRLFGNAGVDEIGDGAVLDRFTGCSPAYCPKPHTMWGFKTITRNVGAYAKLSCHRPNKLAPERADAVRWLNGSLKDVTHELATKGWRNSLGSIGFDAVQLNHYALRSRENFLVKRHRGRALHVDRSIGLNYWVRHDWNRNTDRTILRQMPRMTAAMAALLADPTLGRLHASALDWHRAKVAELKDAESFRELWDQTRAIDLTDAERVAYAVAADMEN